MFKAITWWEDGRASRYFFVHFYFINLLTILWAFAICLQPPIDPCALPEWKHYFCRGCIFKLLPNNGRLLCPLCRRQFSLDQIKPCIPIGETRSFPLALANSCGVSRLFHYLKRVLFIITRQRFSCHLEVGMGKLGEECHLPDVKLVSEGKVWIRV